MKWNCLIGDKRIEFGSELAEHRFYENRGLHVKIELDDKPTAEMRRFFEGAVIPAIFYQHPRSGWKHFRECREAVKLEFLPGYMHSMQGQSVRFPRSTLELSKDGFRVFLGKIEVWMMDNSLEFPDSSEYVAWRDSGPLKGEIFPLVARMKANYEAQQASANPWEKAKFWG